MAPKFVHIGCVQKFLGYAFSQKHKMVIKKDNYFDFISAVDYLKTIDSGKSLIEIILDFLAKTTFNMLEI